ncbi:FAD-dependent oxidoreductase [Marinilactibacillus psychrotolerans]|uniref:FAD-dependent oxidoreductase n=1 Tax=Marinilactibacillus psychrotolerans TaxID=191770 RepID=A0ABW8UKX3_9LACT
MKYIVVGSSHFGYEAVETILEAEPEAEIHLFEREDKASFMSCGAQSYLMNIAQSPDELHYANEESYKKQGINIHLNSDVVGVNADKNTVTVKTDNGEKEEKYDRLLLSPGGYAPKLNIPGNDLEHVYTFRGRNDAEMVKARMEDAKKVVVIGGGYIGVEVAEAYRENGQDVTLIDAVDRFLPSYLDEEFYPSLSKEAEEKGLKIQTNELVQEIKGENGEIQAVVTDQSEYEADTVIMAVGVKPDTSWLANSLKLDEAGFVVVNDYLETSAKNVYAGGDATLIPFKATGKKQNIALATNARKQGVTAAKNAMGEKVEMPVVNGTSGLAFFDLKFATTGLNNANLKNYDGNIKTFYTEERVRPSFMRDGDIKVEMKLFYDSETEVILGAQFLSTGDITQAANTLSLAISNEMTLSDLGKADFFFQPGFSRPWNFLNVLALKAQGETFGSTEMLF